MALHTVRGGSYNSKTAARNRRRAAARRRSRWARMSAGTKALRIAKRNSRIVKMLKPPLKMYEWSTPTLTGTDGAYAFSPTSSETSCWMPIISRTTGVETGPPIVANDQFAWVAPRSQQAPATAHIHIGDVHWATEWNRNGIGDTKDGACIWAAMFDAGLGVTTTTAANRRAMEAMNPHVFAISVPLNHVPRTDDIGSMKHRITSEIYSRSLSVHYAFRIMDAQEPCFKYPSIDRSEQTVNIDVYMISLPIKQAVSNTLLRDAEQLDTTPYATVTTSAMPAYRQFIRNMFKYNILVGARRDNYNHASPLRPGARGQEPMDNPGGNIMSGTTYTPLVTDTPQKYEDERRGHPFKVLMKRSYRLGAHGVSDPFAVYQVEDRMVLHLGKEKFDDPDDTTVSDDQNTFSMSDKEIRLLVIHNGSVYQCPADVAGDDDSTGTAILPTYTQSAYASTPNEAATVWCKAEVHHFFTDT